MIISKTPFRVSLFGGSTDYESFYSEHESFLIGFAINKYCYISTKKTPKIFDYLSRISYSQIEIVNDNKNIQHNGAYGVLQYLQLLNEGYEISCISDLPARTGIGSSSTFIVGLLNCLTNNLNIHKLAQKAIYIERQLLQESGGIQDAIWAAYGGINTISINRSGDFNVQPLAISNKFAKDFMDRCIMIYTGQQRKSYHIAKLHDDTQAKQYKLQILDLAHRAHDLFLTEDINGIGQCLHESWEQKKRISPLISSQGINILYKSLQNDGMIGGKLLGTGGSGFIFGVLYENTNKTYIANKYKNFFVNIDISTHGSRIIHV